MLFLSPAPSFILLFCEPLQQLVDSHPERVDRCSQLLVNVPSTVCKVACQLGKIAVELRQGSGQSLEFNPCGTAQGGLELADHVLEHGVRRSTPILTQAFYGSD